MEFLKLIALCALLAVSQGRRHHHAFSDELMKELVQDVIEKEAEKELLNSINDPLTIDKTDPNFKMCWGAEINCEHCGKCGPNKNGGWCVKDVAEQPGPDCICNYGWTGKNAVYIPDTDQSYHETGWGINRIRADSCDVPCHYTYDVKNATCVNKCFLEPTSPGCTHGTDPKILCCRGWAGPGKVWVPESGRYRADHCDQECQWTGAQNDKCTKRPDNVPPCNLKCTTENNGKCLPTGRCECCKDWTGPNAEHGSNGKIQADYCDVYCPFTVDTHRHNLCVEPDYVNRRRDAGHKIDV